MKKIFILLIMILFTFSSCAMNFAPDTGVVISEDYMTISYNSEVFELSELSMLQPDDCIELEAEVEGKNALSYLLPFDDVVYISESTPEYIWLLTETDSTSNEKFEEVRDKYHILTYKLQK